MLIKRKLNSLLRVYGVYILSAALALGVFFMPACAADDVYTNAVRLHVVANSDSENDQGVKIKVRNEILKALGKQLENMPDDTSSFDYLKENKELIENIAKDTLQKNGYEYGAKANIGIHTYPTRMYNEATLPAGEYKSVRVILGDGEGKNWWCVVYPPMCLGIEDAQIDDVLLDENLSEEESIVVKSWILEYFSKQTPQPNDKAKNRLLNWLNKLGDK